MNDLERELGDFADVLRKLNAANLTPVQRELLQELLVVLSDLLWPNWPGPQRPQDQWAR